MTTQYRPKGSMCASCKRATNNCSTFEFDKMPKLSQYEIGGDIIVTVRCTRYERQQEEGNG